MKGWGVFVRASLPSPHPSPRKQPKQRGEFCCSSSCRSQRYMLSFAPLGCSATAHHSAVVFARLLPASQCAPYLMSTHLSARRFASTSGSRSPTFAEVSEACHVLGVDIDCDQKQLKKVYRDLVRKNHPDAGGDEAAMSRITVGYNRLSGMSKLEKDQFKTQKNAYSRGSYYAGRSSSSNQAGDSYRSGSGYASYNSQNMDSRHGFYDASSNDYFRQKTTNSHGYYNYQQRKRSFTDNPFSTSNPFAFHTQLRRAWRMSMRSIILRGFVVYLGLSMIILLCYRQYSDWQHDDGWKMAESLARHERLSELHRLRQEMNERIRSAREAAAAHRDNVHAFVIRPDNSTDYNAVTSSQDQELLALEYARRRQIHMTEEAKGWPKFNEHKGKLIRRAQDPPGVIIFEPHKEDQRYRQVANMHRGREWSDKKQSAAESGLDCSSAQVPATSVDGNDEVVTTINSILGGLRGDVQGESRSA